MAEKKANGGVIIGYWEEPKQEKPEKAEEKKTAKKTGKK